MAGFEVRKAPSYLSQTPTKTTEEIGQILKEEYLSSDQSIDYFYLQIRKRWVYKKKEISARDDILKALLDHDIEFYKVNPGREWPSIFFFHFPRNGHGLTLREQEEQLNRMVRLPLKRTLEEIFQAYKNPERPEKNPSVHIMITRVCKYTGPDEGFIDSLGNDESY